ncbi:MULTISPECIES: flagellar hook protein FlgE [unclassified Arthrobacter]|uniref:flagellar hook protein FlgE n=1 Tax=unclassified Arthrobacter TaxID=235627 RepID=UPI001492BD7A|nr:MULTISPECIES: flagellar hook protein FlgE [unclassified Arthrobacter]MBE0010811.1 flagellar hook protein FlgE [Arthrobacter sp. AET 35A]NOJ64622.1 flagellar hook protein FlgE [Arthrobacter sp. 147(2020)]
MLRSLYSGISGLRSHQTMLDVTGNNIANVNTTGFKASSAQFQDTLSQLTQGAGGPQQAVGGTNPAQIGLGVQVAGISTNFAQGSAQATGRATDMMVAGEGFFVTQSGGETTYTRAGSFDFDADGRLVSPDGAIVQGWGAVNGQVAGGGIGDITVPREAISAPVRTTTASATGNLPSDAVDGTEVVQDVSVFNAAGEERTLSLTFTKNGDAWNVVGQDEGEAGVPATGNGTLTFDANGNVTGGGALQVGGITVDLAAVTGVAELSTISLAEQNGRSAGTLESFSLAPDGTLIGSFTNGGREPLGRIALANFVNPGGLEKAGGSSYRATVNSGEPAVGAPGADGLGEVAGGMLEMSNVDLSQEFTNLIVAQRGFQANARIITTSDEVLQELSNLKR